MNNKLALTAAALALAVLPGISQARDTLLMLPFQPVVQQMLNEKKLDGSVKFYLKGTGPSAQVISPNAVTNKKTNAFNKTDEAACAWALQSALLTLQDAAKKAGANAVVNIVSYYKRNENANSANYECHAGAIIGGVTLKGDLAKTK
ncbi:MULTISPECIES: excinuclease [unclassified Pseudomonas]|uniref:excinuclease n=1 Tax=unclassified Pseudomonas TaxID=196821 RepID=UPI000BD3C3A5|nr:MULTISPECIES: excinuclease [unclassified Pseudomonas]PVZ15474.1 hypothetical protein F474_02251 [Pseudomonas sp. URIL14HWK12:I12]PVZ24848.1 hypothetical protein F470_01906 [Pseudomonas sp. URIL14HWK12:I10]PVZ34694.1 hypothetical protein F472_02252 [Pseudomonas sp. URIL14HWK12:I11]SNZ08987.1 hypothetical protein SAMN05660463_01239 [Pseudomonas sp. URIL14HWK12:I9]